MCYGSRCDFEDSFGNCKVRNYEKFEKEFGYKSCTVGGVACCKEEDEFIQENESLFSEIKLKAIENGFAW